MTYLKENFVYKNTFYFDSRSSSIKKYKLNIMKIKELNNKKKRLSSKIYLSCFLLTSARHNESYGWQNRTKNRMHENPMYEKFYAWKSYVQQKLYEKSCALINHTAIVRFIITFWIFLILRPIEKFVEHPQKSKKKRFLKFYFIKCLE